MAPAFPTLERHFAVFSPYRTVFTGLRRASYQWPTHVDLVPGHEYPPIFVFVDHRPFHQHRHVFVDVTVMPPEVLGERINRERTRRLERLDQFPALGREDLAKLRHRLETNPAIGLDGVAGHCAFERRAEPVERNARRLDFDMQDVEGHRYL